MAGKYAIAVRLGAEGDEKIIAALKKIGETGDAAMQGLSREARNAARDFDRLEMSLDAQARSAAQVAKTYVQANNAVAAGVRTQEDAQRVLDLATRRHLQLTGAVNDNAHAVGLARHEWINLSRQFQDVGVSLAGGQAPLTVLLQQGSQIADIFGSSGAGAAGALRSFGAGAVKALASPIGVAAGLAAAVLGVKAAGDAAAESLAKLGEEARQTGLTPNRVAGAKIVGARAGLDDKSAVGAFANARAEFEAFSRNSGQVKDILEKVDKSFLSVADRARGASEWIDRIVQKIRELPSAQGLNLSKALFGDDAGRKLFEEIQRGAVSMASLIKEAEKAGANFDASAEHAERMKREIAEAENIASTKLLSVFGDLAQPSLFIEKSWAKTKINIADAVKSARDLYDAPAIRRAAAQREGALAGAEIGRLLTGKDPFAGKSFSDVDPLTNLFTQGQKPETVGATRKLFESTGRKGGASSAAEKHAETYERITRELENQVRLTSSVGAEHDKVVLAIKIENEQLKLGKDATQAELDNVAALVTKIDAAGKAQGELNKEAKAYSDAFREVGDIAKDSLKEFLRDLQKGESLSKSLRNSWKGFSTKIQDKAVDNLVDSLFGKSGDSSGGLIGSMFSKGGGLGGLFPSGGLANMFGGSSGGTGYFSGGSLFSGSSFSFGFADGGIMTARGPLPLHRYAGGGIANSPQLAMFGEGRMPEAYVPLPNGNSIPVEMRGQAPNITIHNNAPVDVTPRVMSDGQILLHIEQRIAQTNRRRDEAGWRGNR